MHEINFSVPVKDSGAGGFNFSLEVANMFNDIVLDNNLYNFAVKQLCNTYQSHVLQYTTYQTYWNQAITEFKYFKNDDGKYKDGAFQKNCNTFFSYVAATGCPVAAGNVLLHYMHSGKKKT